MHFAMSSGPYGLLKRLCDPLGYVFASLLGCQDDLAMLLRRQPDGKPPGEGLVWHLPTLGTKRQIVLNRICKCLAEFVDRLPLKRHDIPDIDDLAMEKIRLFIESNMGEISFICHHGSIPASVRKRRIDITAPLSVSFCE
jgi:hypothetical protein